MSYSTEFERLQRRVLEIRVKNHNGQRFVPGDKLDEIISREAVTQVLFGSIPAYLNDEIVSLIIRGAKRVFAVLLLLNQVQQILRFIQKDQYGTHQLDHQLPFTVVRLNEILEDEHIADLFSEKQWEFTVPTFSGHVAPRTLQNETILPYLTEEYITTGGFGAVYKIRIHPFYHPPSAGGVAQLVRKELDFYETTFENEARILSMLQRLEHPNILPLLGCYTYRSKHNLISPFIKGGTLRHFLKQPKPTCLSSEELLFSLTGLASALWALHEFALEDSEPSMKGHHQDLRPDNIFVDGSRFILADFGLSSIRNVASNSRTVFKGRKGYYQAPECADLTWPYHEHEVTRAVDIFAFGCTVTDLLVYLHKGASGVQEFEEKREFRKPPFSFSHFHKGDSAHEVVAEYLQEISVANESQIMKGVVQLVKQMLDNSPAKRPTAAVVTAELCINTIMAFSKRIIARFHSVAPTFALIIEKSRFLSWLNCQQAEMYMSMFSATTTNKVFESTIELLRRIDNEIKVIGNNRMPVDHRTVLEVRTLLTQLLNMLSTDRRSSLRSNLESILIAEIENSNIHVDSEILESAFGPRITRMAKTKELVARVNNDTMLPRSLSFRSISGSEFSKTSSGRLQMATLHGNQKGQSTPMLVESIQYQDPLTGRTLLPRLESLCALLSSKTLTSQLRSPPFYALCNNTDAYCYDMLYRYPSTDDMERQRVSPVSLRKLLTTHALGSGPPLETRYSLALHVAEALAGFHDVSWFHKDLTSWNVLFFPPLDADVSSQVQRPYLFGFQHSRSASDDLTSGPVQDKKHHRYHHPNYISIANSGFKSFVQQYDWYSLGIVLVEIGFWMAIDAVMKEYANLTNIEFSTALVQEKMNLLSFHMGTEYMRVVTYCLTCSNGSVEEQGHSLGLSVSSVSPSLVFKERVIFPLQALVTRHAIEEKSLKRKLIIEPGENFHDESKRRQI